MARYLVLPQVTGITVPVAAYHAMRRRIEVCCKRKSCHQMIGRCPSFWQENHRTMVVILWQGLIAHELSFLSQEEANLAEAGSLADGHWCGLCHLCGWCPKSSISLVFCSDGLRTGNVFFVFSPADAYGRRSTVAMLLLKVDIIKSHLVLWQSKIRKLLSAWMEKMPHIKSTHPTTI